MRIHSVPYQSFLTSLLSSDDEWVVLTSVNFEECCTTVSADLLRRMGPQSNRRIRFQPFRLFSRRASPWSALEIVKDQLSDHLGELAKQKGIPWRVAEVDTPVSEARAGRLIATARGALTSSSPGLVLDISALPRRLGTYLCDIVCGLRSDYVTQFSKVFVVQTPPARITSREGLGPFSVGLPRPVYSDDCLNFQDLKAALLLFPGYEGFEAAAAIDTLVGHNASVSVAVGCGEGGSYAEAAKLLIANQSILHEAPENQGSVDLQFYFSELDAMRVARDVVERSIRLCVEMPQKRHLFLVAPFGPKWAMLIGSVARSEFLRGVRARVPNASVMTDVLSFQRSQYVSLYSRGNQTPCVFEVEEAESHDEIAC
jgi:hypothetical protein